MSILYLEIDTVEGVVALLKHHSLYGEHVAPIGGVQQLGYENVGEAVLDSFPLAPSSNLHHVVAGWPVALRGEKVKGCKEATGGGTREREGGGIRGEGERMK
jgi:hypothetical protein